MTSSEDYSMEVREDVNNVNTITCQDGRTTWTQGNDVSQVILNACDRIISLYIHFSRPHYCRRLERMKTVV